MKMFLVDHIYGACLVLASNREEAMDMADVVGDVFGVYEIKLPMVFNLRREIVDEGTEDEHTAIEVEADDAYEFSEALEELLQKHAVTLDADEYAALTAEKQVIGSPRESG